MDSMIDRVARAINNGSDEMSLAFTDMKPTDTETIRRCRTFDTEKRLQQARLAIAAMREPTQEMLDTAYNLGVESSDAGGTFYEAAPSDTWPARIDEALK